MTQATLSEIEEVLLRERIYAFKALNDVAHVFTHDIELTMPDMKPLIMLMSFYWGEFPGVRETLYRMHHKDKEAVYLFKILSIIYALRSENQSVDMEKVIELAEEYSDKNFEDIDLNTH